MDAATRAARPRPLRLKSSASFLFLRASSSRGLHSARNRASRASTRMRPSERHLHSGPMLLMRLFPVRYLSYSGLAS